MEAHPSQGHVRLALPLIMAWASMKLSAAQRSVLDCLAVECWGMGRKGYECTLTGAEIGRRVGITKRGANKALEELESRGLIVRDGDNIRICPDIPAKVQPLVRAWFRKMRGTDVPLPDRTHDTGGTDVPERGTDVPPRLKGTRARKIDLTSSSINSEHEQRDDDEHKPVVKQLAHALVDLAAAMCNESRETLLAQLRKLNTANLASLARALAQVIVAVDDGRVQPRDLRALVGHALNNPEAYADVKPSEVLAAIELRRQAAERESEKRRKLDAVLADDLRRVNAERLRKAGD